MTKQNVAEPESLGEAMNRTELFFEKNGRKLTYVFLGLLVLAALVYGYRALIVAPRRSRVSRRRIPTSSWRCRAMPTAPGSST